METKEEYIKGLSWRLNTLKDEITEMQKTIQELFDKVSTKQDQAKYLMILLKTEGVNIDDPDLASLTDIAIADIVYDYMSESGLRKPLHYEEITKEILAKGILIPGKNPASNLLSHIYRDNRFVRTSPGTYGLREWGLKETVAQKRKPTRRK